VRAASWPGHIREAIHCDLPDVGPARRRHLRALRAAAGTGAKVIAFYYRSAAWALYNATILERVALGLVTSRRSLGPASRASCCTTYVEGRNDKQAVAASYGKRAYPQRHHRSRRRGRGKVAKRK
jgi:hypothetical protein